MKPHPFDIPPDEDAEGSDEELTTSITSFGPAASHQTADIPILGDNQGQLIVLVGDMPGRTYTVGKDVLVGRGGDAMVRLTVDDVSRHHARITRGTDGEFMIEDLGSRNGTRVNGLPIRRQSLRFGDKIGIGQKTILMFTYYDRLEDRLLQSQKLEAMGRLAGGIAHDFNNLLGAILANVSYLQHVNNGTALSDAEVQSCLADTSAAAQRATDLTHQLLSFARSNKHEERPVDISALVEEVTRMLKRTLNRNVRIEQHVTPELAVVGDRSQLHQVMMNLCLNASDAMQNGGLLAIIVDCVHFNTRAQSASVGLSPGSYVRIAVRDTGAGMDEKVKSRIFEPFFTTKEPGRGTGLGLPTVQSIVTAHGGSVIVDSVVGSGTTFWAYLPQSEVVVPKVQSDEFLSSGTIGTKGVILLAEDEEVVRNSTSRLLESMGYAVLRANDGLEALRIFKESSPMIRLVLLDINMPNMDGEQTYYALRQLDPNVNVLLTSGQLECEALPTLINSGAKGFIAKPFDRTALRDKISGALTRL